MAKFHKAEEEFQVNSTFIGVEVVPGMTQTGWEGHFNVRCFGKSDSIFIKGDKYIYKCTGETLVYDGDTFWQFVAVDDTGEVWFVDNSAQTPDELAMTVGDDLYYLQIVDGEVVNDYVLEQISNVDMQADMSYGVFISRTQAWMYGYGVGTIEEVNPRYGFSGVYKFSVNGNLIGISETTEDVNFDADVEGDPEYDPENPNFVYWAVPENTAIPSGLFDDEVLLTDAFEDVISIKVYNSESLYPQVGNPFYMNIPLQGPAGPNTVQQIYEEEDPVDVEVEWSVTRERWQNVGTLIDYCFDLQIPRYMFLRFSQDVWITEE